MDTMLELIPMSLIYGLPEITLAVSALVLLILGVYFGDRFQPVCITAAVGAMALSAICLIWNGLESEHILWGGFYVIDSFSTYFKLLILVGASGCLIISQGYLVHYRIFFIEYPVLIILSVLGMMIMVSANDLISLYMGLELQSLALYVLAAFRRDSARASEAGLKYFILGALTSGIILYGASLIYGFAQTTRFDTLHALLSAPEGVSSSSYVGLMVGLSFVLAGLAFKVSAVPFHMWAPDVYEGAPTPVTAFFSSVAKLAAFSLLIRVLMGPFAEFTSQWTQIISMLAVLSIALGAFATIVQKNIKRLLAYSSIGHVGYVLIGVAAGTQEGLQAVAVYLTIYMLTSVGVFSCVLAMKSDGRYLEKIDDLAGLSKNHPLFSIGFAVFMFSLAGIPPLAGFFGKFYIFMVAVNQQMYMLAIVGVLGSVVSAFYYLRIVKIIYFNDSKLVMDKLDSWVAGVIGVTTVATLLFFIFPSWILGFTNQVAISLVH